MEWIKVKIFTDKDNQEELQWFLMDMGINGCTVEDSADFNDFLKDKSFNWDYIDNSLMKWKDIRSSITVYLADNEQGNMQLDCIKKHIPLKRKISVKTGQITGSNILNP